MTCASYEPLIALYVENDLPVRETAGIEAHLAGCATCRAFAAALSLNQRALRELGQEHPDPQALAVVRQRVRTALESPVEPRTARFAPVWAIAAAAGVAVLAFLLQQRTDGGPAAPPVAPTVVHAPAVPRTTPPVRPLATPSSGPITPRPAEASAPRTARTGSRGTPTRRVAVPAARSLSPQPDLLIKLVTSDPDIVIYWLVEQNGGKS